MNDSFDQQAAQSPGAVDRLAAGRAQPRQRQIERRPQARARAVRGG